MAKKYYQHCANGDEIPCKFCSSQQRKPRRSKYQMRKVHVCLCRRQERFVDALCDQLRQEWRKVWQVCQVENCQARSMDIKMYVTCRNNLVSNGGKCEVYRDKRSACLDKLCHIGENADKCKSFVGNFDPKGVPACIEYLDGFFRSETRGKRICAACSKKCIECKSVEVGNACQDVFGVAGGKCTAGEDANRNICSADNNSCGICKTGYKLFGGKCERECNAYDAVCATNQICLGTCKTCSENCKSCVPGFALDGSSCAACSAGCADCAGDKNVCRICKDCYFGINGACQSCQNNATAQCECSWAANCATCDTAKSGTGGTCIAGYKMSASNTCFTAFKCTSDAYMSYLVTLIRALQRLIANTANFAIYQTLGILIFVSCFL
ncbi:Cysteine-rich membrane protein 2 [Spironucleus salmonicida]|uniref:Cysteine-rich membrane protein 2 n=1 Tax=Spironucleus salmonicida TaxID=348837 RepID=V6LNY5_9EUKA|nr:Cysteine-rich membrane protein 2 [Spironucleus salmonicida]|eukprot:EST42444.1 Cysteine-rich membrane protein 2 [Spironucleus salmonicida]